MRFTRPVRLAGLTTAAVAAYAATAAADPTWATALGVDVWNVGRLEDDLTRLATDRERLETRAERMAAVFQATDAAVDELIAGRLPLAVAAAELWERNRIVGGYYQRMRQLYPHATDRERAARNMIDRAERAAGRRADWPAVRARLEGELAGIVGSGQ